jgi:hypothetical protein
VTPDFFASDRLCEEIALIMKRARAGEITVLPVLLRPVDLQGSLLAGLQTLPRDGQPIMLRRDHDEAWVEVVAELRSAVQFRPRPRPKATPRALQPTTASTPAAPPRPILQIGDIFRTTGQPEITFVEPQQLPRLTVYLDTMGQGLVVEGPSGVGKTNAVRRALKDTVKRFPEHWVRSKEPEQRAALDSALDRDFQGHLIVDDFHYLDAARQGRLADQIKSLADQGRKDAKITLIGINPVGVSLTQGFPDLVGRFKTVAMTRQPPEKIDELIRKGEVAANVIFQRRDEFVRDSRGSFQTAQLLCFNACMREGVVSKTGFAEKTIAAGPADLRQDILDDLRDKYHTGLTTFAVFDESTPPRGACLILLWLLSRENFDYVAIDDASHEFPELAPAFAWLKGGRLAEHFSRNPQIDRLLHYDARAGVISAEDPQLEFYLRNLQWPKFATMTGHRNVHFGSDGKPNFGQTTSEADMDAAATIALYNLGATLAVTPPAPAGAAVSATPVPTALREALAAGRVIPFVGAGVSMAVMVDKRPGERLFPSWAALLQKAAERLDADGAAGDAMAVRGALTKKQPNYLEAARNARDGLGAVWFDVLKKAIDPPRGRADNASLSLPRAIWSLGSKILVTTNYDRVLHWTCPEQVRDDLRYWDIEAPAELVQLLRDGLEYPTIWHLHGYIANAADLILTPDGYSRLYPGNDADGEHYRAALTSLRILLASRTFLFIGFSFEDASFGDQLRWMNDTFAGAAGPHYVLVREAERERVRSRLSGMPMEVLSYADHGEPLLARLRELAALREPS